MIGGQIEAAGTIEAPAAAVFSHLADLRTHWALTSGRVRLIDDDGAGAARGGRVIIRGPLGLQRRAMTEVVRTEPPRLLQGRARLGARTEATIHWRLEPLDEATRVSLCATVVRAGVFDRLLLALGARRWLEAMFVRVLDRLAALAPDLRGEGVGPPTAMVETR